MNFRKHKSISPSIKKYLSEYQKVFLDCFDSMLWNFLLFLFYTKLQYQYSVAKSILFSNDKKTCSVFDEETNKSRKKADECFDFRPQTNRNIVERRNDRPACKHHSNLFPKN